VNSSLLACISVSLLHVSNAEYEGEEHAKGSDGDVANGQEVVLASQGVGGRDNETLLTLERQYLVLVVNFDIVIAWL